MLFRSLTSSLVVNVVDQYGNPVPGQTVTFTGDGSAADGTTDANGDASTSWTLDTFDGAQTITAAAGASSVEFSATANADVPATMTIVSGDDQTGTVGQSLTSSLVVNVVDQYGNPVPGQTVTFTGDGSAADGTTDEIGRAHV